MVRRGEHGLSDSQTRQPDARQFALLALTSTHRRAPHRTYVPGNGGSAGSVRAPSSIEAPNTLHNTPAHHHKRAGDAHRAHGLTISNTEALPRSVFSLQPLGWRSYIIITSATSRPRGSPWSYPHGLVCLGKLKGHISIMPATSYRPGLRSPSLGAPRSGTVPGTPKT
jgi:hypothetical protein